MAKQEIPLQDPSVVIEDGGTKPLIGRTLDGDSINF